MTWTSFRHWTWELPQTLLGWLIMAFFMLFVENTTKHRLNNEVVLVTIKQPLFGVSLGRYVVLNYLMGTQTLNHEIGHCIQSKILGPLYLIVVGLPSITMNILSTFGILRRDRYYKRWPESWADELGEVNR